MEFNWVQIMMLPLLHFAYGDVCVETILHFDEYDMKYMK